MEAVMNVLRHCTLSLLTGILALGLTTELQAKAPIRTAFFNEYPSAVGTQIETLPSNSGHCGVCHYDFNGGGARNPYGADLEANISGKDYAAAIQAIANEDSDGDGLTNIVEITDTNNFGNTPTFPGLSSANSNLVVNVDAADIAPYLFPSTGEDNDPPLVAVTAPNGGETATGNDPLLITWTASDSGSGLSGIELYLSLDNGVTWKHITKTLPGSDTSFEWFVSNRPSSNALIRVEAYDNAGNDASDSSDAVFTIVSPPGGLAPTTLRDFDQPGSQPIEESGLAQADPASCAGCHGGYDETHEPYFNWLGSMMAHASYDPLFKANLAIANQDAPDSGDLCLRCHNSRGWLDGRSTPTDGSQMTEADMFGVSCDLCHRMVDPLNLPGAPAIDTDILASLEDVPQHQGNGMFVFDPNSNRRGPFDDTISPHEDLYSPFHRESAICGTCHDVSNPVFVRDGTNDEYIANSFDAPATNFSPEILVPVERTYSEWLHSAYNSSNGVYAPQFAGFKADGMVASCQDCHMPDILGYGADTNQYPVAERPDLPLHDMTGGSSWMLKVLPTLTNFPYAAGTPEAAALTNGAERADYMLRKAARMAADQIGSNLNVMVINDTGHKLPTGYPEGRRIWINVRFYDETDTLLDEYGGYDYSTGVLTKDTTVYEVHPGIGTNLYHTLTNLNPGLDIEPGPSFHFVLNNQIFEDNRIPPRGFTNSEFDTFGGAPVGHHYDDGQYWDNTLYAIPEGAVRAHARLYYQSTSKEFIEFLLNENTTDDTGTNMYNLWVANDRCPPVLMTEAFWPENFTIESIGPVDGDKMGISFNSISGYTYWVEFTDELGSNAVWKPFASNSWFEVYDSTSSVTDDYTSATSGGAPTNGTRFYRIQR
jgi:mono/diheme cytochrome c family protein